MTTYPIFERFSTFQGEGVHIGRPAFFIRTHGCPLKCPWCDSAGTWHPNFVPKDVQKMRPEELCEEVLQGPKVNFVVITGGEPTIFDLNPLVDVFHSAGIRVHLETSGAFPILGVFDWITLSPKRNRLPLPGSVAIAKEFKIIVEKKEDIDFFTNVLLTRCANPNSPVWLHPEWSHREDPVVLGAIADAVVNGKGLYRAGWQLHKLYQVDARDGRARPLVPLGGDMRRGF